MVGGIVVHFVGLDRGRTARNIHAGTEIDARAPDDDDPHLRSLTYLGEIGRRET